MTKYHTNNPLGSTDPRDLYDNAQNFDAAVNDLANDTWKDRFGRERKTLKGYDSDFQQFLIDSGYVNIGDYAAGLEITARNQIFWRDGELYRAGASLELPYTTTGDWGDEEGLFVAVSDRTAVKVSSISSLLLMTGYSDNIYFVNEYAPGSVYGGGIFLWDPDSTSEPDGGTIFSSPGATEGRWVRSHDELLITFFGADPTGATDSTQAISRSLQGLANSNFDSLRADGHFIFSDHVGDIPEGKTLVGGKFTASSDVPGFAHLKNGASILNCHIDFGMNQCTGGYGITTGPSATIEGCTIHDAYNLQGTSGGLYLIRCSVGEGEINIRNNNIFGAYNTGDNLPTNYGFSGHVFIQGDPLQNNEKMIVNIENNRFSKTRTVFLPGADRDEKLEDNDADSIRCYVDGTPSINHYERLVINSRNNVFSECQKRIYKINHASIFINNDSSHSPINEPDIPGMVALMQLHAARFEMYNSDYHITSVRNVFIPSISGGIGTASHDLPNIIRGTTVRVTKLPIDEVSRITFFSDISSSSRWRMQDIRVVGVDMFFEALTPDLPYFEVDGLVLFGAYSLVEYDHTGNNLGYIIKNARCMLRPRGDDNRGRTIHNRGSASGSSQKGATLIDVYLEDIAPRTQSGAATPHPIHNQSSKTFINNLIHKGHPDSTLTHMVFNGGSDILVRGLTTGGAVNVSNTTDATFIYCATDILNETENTGFKQGMNIDFRNL